MKNELTAAEEAYVIEYLNHGHERAREVLDLVRRWDSIPHDAPDPTHPQYTQRQSLLASYLNWSHTRAWAWEGMQSLLAELERRREPIPETVSIWAYAVALENLPRPERQDRAERANGIGMPAYLPFSEGCGSADTLGNKP